MREISLHLLDLVQNAAEAVKGMENARISIDLIWDEQPGNTPAPRLTLCVADNGCGMTVGQLQRAQSPFYSTRAKCGADLGHSAGLKHGPGSRLGIGLGLPLCRAAALRTGGTFSLESAPGHGTRVRAVFCPAHIDCVPLGDLPETLAVIVGGHPEITFTIAARVVPAAHDAANCIAAQGAAEDTAQRVVKNTTQDTAERAAGGAKPTTTDAVQEITFHVEPDALRALTQGFPPGDARTILQLRQYFTENLSLFLQKGEHGMKSLEELAAIRDKMKQTVETREAAHDATRVTVGMGTSGIAAGARGVLNAFAEEVTKSGLHGVLVTQSGSIGPAGYEPVVEVVRAGAEKVTYVKMTPEKAARVVAEHLAGAAPVAEYTIENAQ